MTIVLPPVVIFIIGFIMGFIGACVLAVILAIRDDQKKKSEPKPPTSTLNEDLVKELWHDYISAMKDDSHK